MNKNERQALVDWVTKTMIQLQPVGLLKDHLEILMMCSMMA